MTHVPSTFVSKHIERCRKAPNQVTDMDVAVSPDHWIKSLDALEALYSPANPRAIAKETQMLTPAYRKWIEWAPFFALATSGPGGLDCSPRGDASEQLVHIMDDRHIAFPDRQGNNRLDSLKNIIADPKVGLLFLVPGILETLRVNGTARITTDPEMKALFQVNGKDPVTVVVVRIEAVYFQCARALLRARLWDAASHVPRQEVPTAGQMIKGALPQFDADQYDDALDTRLAENLY